MIKIIGLVISVIYMMILSMGWMLISSNLIYYLRSKLINRITKSNCIGYAFILGFILEVSLSLISIVIWGSKSPGILDESNGIISGIENGYAYAVLLTPLTSFLSAYWGLKSHSPPWRRLF